MQTREINEDRFYICSGCFGSLTEFVLGHPKLVKGLGLPSQIRVEPLDSVSATGTPPCERCNKNPAAGYLPLAIPEQVVV